MIATSPLVQTVRRNRRVGLRYNFHPGQLQAWDSDCRFVFMLAGTQGGKTSYGPLWLHREIQRCGPGDYMAVTSTFPLLKLKMLPEFLGLFDHTLHLGTWRASDRVFEFAREATRVIFGSATNSESLESATAKAAWCDEIGQDQFRLDSWEAMLRRLALHQGRALCGTTIYNVGWLKQHIYDEWQQGNSDIDVIQFPSTMNPAFPQAEYDRAQRSLATWKFNMFYRGVFDRPPGLIYADFRDTYREDGGHKVHAFDIPREWPRHVGVDFGAVNTATIWLTEDPVKHVYYVYRETLEGGKTTAEHAKSALQAASTVNVRTWHGGSKSETQQRLDWSAAGVPLREPPIDDVESGIDAVIALLKRWRLYIFDSCCGLMDEFGTYSRVLGADGQATEKIKDKETFHRLDALRYVSLGMIRRGVFVG